jgi:hypothetical protein
MTKKDYQLIAEAIKQINESIHYSKNTKIDSRLVTTVLDHLVYETLGQALKKDNPNFNYVKFYEACGLEN